MCLLPRPHHICVIFVQWNLDWKLQEKIDQAIQDLKKTVLDIKYKVYIG